jgi:hypothetical protein
MQKREAPIRFLVAMAMSVGVAGAVGCGNDAAVESDEQARRAYLGLDLSVDKSIELGFAGFNAATSANIPIETAPGNLDGTVTVTGQVDQGASKNKGMRLAVAFMGYSDVAQYVYDTDPARPAPALTMMLKDVPSGTLEGAMNGDFLMRGTLEGVVTLALAFTATLEPDPAGGIVHRAPGTTHITGTAVSPAGSYTVDVMK